MPNFTPKFSTPLFLEGDWLLFSEADLYGEGESINSVFAIVLVRIEGDVNVLKVLCVFSGFGTTTFNVRSSRTDQDLLDCKATSIISNHSTSGNINLFFPLRLSSFLLHIFSSLFLLMIEGAIYRDVWD